MKRSKRVKRLNRSKKASKLIALVIILAVCAVGLDIVLSHTSSPAAGVTATSGSLTGNASVQKNSSATNGQYVQFDTTPDSTN